MPSASSVPWRPRGCRVFVFDVAREVATLHPSYTPCEWEHQQHATRVHIMMPHLAAKHRLFTGYASGMLAVLDA